MVKNLLWAFQSQLSFQQRVGWVSLPAQSSRLFLSIRLTDQVALISTPASLCWGGEGAKTGAHTSVSPARTVQRALGSKLPLLGRDRWPIKNPTSRVACPLCHLEINLWFWRWQKCTLLELAFLLLFNRHIEKKRKKVKTTQDADEVLMY